MTHVSEDRHQYFCQLCKFIGKSERELDRHIVHYAKHKQCREKLEMSSAFTAEEDYRVVRKDTASYWQFDCKRDCTKLSMLDSQQLWGSRMRPKSNFTEITTQVCPVPSTDTSSLYVFPAASVDVSPLEPAALPSPLKSPPYTVERAVLPDIVFPPPGEGEIVEDILEQILPEDDRSVSRSDSFQTLEGLTQAVLAGNAIQQKMLEVQLKMLAAVNKTNDQLVKVEVAIRRQRVLPPAPPPPVWNRSNRPYISRRNFTRSPTPDQIKLRSVVRRRSESPPAKKPRKH